MFCTPSKPAPSIHDIEGTLKAESMMNSLKSISSFTSFIAAVILFVFLYFIGSTIISFIQDGGMDYRVSVLLFKISMGLALFVIMIYSIMFLIYKKMSECFVETGKNIKLIKEASEKVNKKIERLKFYDETEIKEKIKQLTSLDMEMLNQRRKQS